MLDILKNWLSEQGGPAIQLRLSAMKNTNGVKNDVDNAVSTLLEIESVRKILNYFDAFETSDRSKKTLEHLIHYYKDTCIERFFPVLMDLGFRAGIPIFDEKMEPVADIFRFMYAYTNENGHYIYSLMVHQHFFMSGYLFPEVVESMENRIDLLHKAAAEKILDIYQDESKLPKKPEIWTNYGVFKDEFNPWGLEKPVPVWYDIPALAYYADKCADSEKMKKINDIVAYIISPEVQKLPREGLFYVKARHIYHAGGFGVTLPLYDDTNILEIFDIMSHFETARKTKWFQDCLNYFNSKQKPAHIYSQKNICVKDTLIKRFLMKRIWH
jgi:hypothetical protein